MQSSERVTVAQEMHFNFYAINTTSELPISK